MPELEWNSENIPKAGRAALRSTVSAPGLSVELYEMATGGFFIFAKFESGARYYSPIFRDEAMASARQAEMAHNAHEASQQAANKHRCSRCGEWDSECECDEA